jgi:hypothetical protein
MQKLFRPILVCLVSGVISASAIAAPKFRVIGAKLEADPKQYVGQCPTVIHFHGSIETNGPGVVKYIFERNDGGIDTIVKSVTFTAAPYHMAIPDQTWTLGGPGMNYSGWERIKILSPNAGFYSNKANFAIRCTGGTAGTGPSTTDNPSGTPNGRPDLVVTQFGFTGPVPTTAANTALCQPHTAVYNFQVTVKNQGSAASPSSASLGNKALVQVMAQDKAGWGNGVYLNSLAPGASQTVNVPVYYLISDPAFMVSGAPHPFMAIADPLGLVNESDEANNKKGPINMGAPAGCPKP